MDTGQGSVLLGIVAMILLEVNHLKWIWYEKWQCRKCGLTPKECGHGVRWMMLL